MSDFQVDAIRKDFPILHQQVHGKPLVFLDNAASTQKPRQVIDALSHYYQHDHANIHRGVYQLSERATIAYESAREKVQRFINAEHAHEIIFLRGTTEAINLVAQSFGRLQIKSGDEIILSTMEHHSNIVPWQLLAEQVGAKLRVISLSDNGELDLASYQQLLNKRTKLVAVVHVSNVLGTINPVKKIIELAHAHNVPVLLDGAQALPHMAVDVRDLDCDFYAFSAHKMYGPTGIGVLYGKTHWLEKMPPYQGGGEMIIKVQFSHSDYHKLPHKFEAGTPHIAGVVGLGAAVDYLQSIGLDIIADYEQSLLEAARQALADVPGLRLMATPQHSAAVISFTLDNVHPHDVGSILDYNGVAIRAGHHCAMPLMEHLGVPATARVSFAFYNTKQELEPLVQGLYQVKKIFG